MKRTYPEVRFWDDPHGHSEDSAPIKEHFFLYISTSSSCCRHVFIAALPNTADLLLFSMWWMWENGDVAEEPRLKLKTHYHFRIF